MNYKSAKHKSIYQRVLGTLIGLISFTVLIISVLKFFYFRLDGDGTFSALFSNLIKKLIHIIYEKTQFLSCIWELAPVPNHLNLSDQGNIHFLSVYCIFFIGIALKSAGDKLAKRLLNIREQIEEQLIKESIHSKEPRTREEIERSISIKSTSFFSQFQQLYIAPLLTAIVAGVILKLNGF